MPKSPKLESLWIDEAENYKKQARRQTKRKVLSKKKSMHFLRLFDQSADEIQFAKSKQFDKLISTPFGFDHVAHIDSKGSFGLENSFHTVDLSVLPQFMENTASHEKNVMASFAESSRARSFGAKEPSEKTPRTQQNNVPFKVYSSFRTSSILTSSQTVASSVPGVPIPATPSVGHSPYSIKHMRSASVISSLSNKAISRSDSVFTRATTVSTMTSLNSSPAQSVQLRRKSNGVAFRSIYEGGIMLSPKEFLPLIRQEGDNKHHHMNSSMHSNSSASGSASGSQSRSGSSSLRYSRLSRDSTASTSLCSNLLKTDKNVGQRTESHVNQHVEDSESDDDIKLEKFELSDLSNRLAKSKSTPALMETLSGETETKPQRSATKEYTVRFKTSEIVQAPIPHSISSGSIGSSPLCKRTDPCVNDAEEEEPDDDKNVEDFFGDLGLDNVDFGHQKDLDKAFLSLILDDDDSSQEDESEAIIAKTESALRSLQAVAVATSRRSMRH
ncbi:hypothetical protein FOA43_003495 [Brettanomyces nanus]|uniref:CRIB domain-containing protein n=1 Tax=Eeniella nana TaxID=13502 RepID=A0A875S8W4_EENNA|nr:uncharacterized protein FOA43_003495 [Brettanomyces nanus]QPG76109.1 hypothetical protein FOA43_003495 [Brettanomyces nanus]